MAEEIQSSEVTQEPEPRPVNDIMNDVYREIVDITIVLGEVQDGEALFHEMWPSISDFFDTMVDMLLKAGMKVNRDNNPIYIELREKVEAFLAEN